MSDNQPLSDSVQRLACIGDPRGMREWADGNPDYLSQYGITPADIPQLIALALQWAEETEWTGDEAGYAPIHAWRALGQLRAAEAVEPLVGIMNTLDAMTDDWHGEEFPDVFARIGPVAIAPLEGLLSDPANRPHARLHASRSLAQIAVRHPAVRDAVAQIITRQLEKREPSGFTVNAGLISDLIDLGAVESAEAIERAFSADVVDVGYVGDWQAVKEKMGVAGLGLPQPTKPHDSGRAFRQAFLKAQLTVERENAQQANRERHKKLAAKLREKRKGRKRK